MKSIPLGAIEKWLLFEQMEDPSFFTNWLVTLEQPLEQRLLGRALEELRRLSPVHFSRIGIADDGQQITAEFDPARDIDDFIIMRDEWEGGAHEYLRHLLTHPLNPFSDGMFRCHCVLSPEPMVALQSSHVAGDGFTNNWLRATFVELYSRLHEERKDLDTGQPKLDGYDLHLGDVRPKIPVATIDFGDQTPPRTMRRPRMSADARDLGEMPLECQVRTFRAELDRSAFRSFFARAQGFGVSTLAYMAACMALAVDRCYDDWAEQPGDFFAVNIPRDFRFVPEWRGHLGNVVYPVGVPIMKDSLGDLEHTATNVFNLLDRAKDNWLFYRLFSHEVRAAKNTTVEAARTSSKGPRLDQQADTVFLEPLPVLGVTELPSRKGRSSIGPARIAEVYFQSPIIGRRSVEGGTVLAGNVHWHPLFDDRIRGFLQTFLDLFVQGSPNNPADVEWELI